jgi:hypothetical protein
MVNQPVNDINLYSLKEAVRTIKELKWAMNDSEDDYLT